MSIYRRKFLKVNTPTEAQDLVNFYGSRDEWMHCYAIQCGTLVCIRNKINQLEKLNVTEREDAIGTINSIFMVSVWWYIWMVELIV